jgi:hypothetical protein
MKYVKGAVSTGLVVGLAFIGMIASVAVVVIASYVSAANLGNRLEKQLDAQYVQNQNVLGQYTLKIQEAVQVPSMYKEDLKEVLKAAMEGRYGADGSKAVFNWIKENNLSFDSSMYTKMQQLIEAGRNEFSNEQKRMIDVKRTYETELGTVWTGFWMKLAGYPKLDLSKYKPVVAGDTAEVFKRGTQDPIKLR